MWGQALFSIFLARSANRRLDKVSSALIFAGDTLQIMTWESKRKKVKDDDRPHPLWPSEAYKVIHKVVKNSAGLKDLRSTVSTGSQEVDSKSAGDKLNMTVTSLKTRLAGSIECWNASTDSELE